MGGAHKSPRPIGGSRFHLSPPFPPCCPKMLGFCASERPKFLFLGFPPFPFTFGSSESGIFKSNQQVNQLTPATPSDSIKATDCPISPIFRATLPHEDRHDVFCLSSGDAVDCKFSAWPGAEPPSAKWGANSFAGGKYRGSQPSGST